jgi:hypothetical protein
MRETPLIAEPRSGRMGVKKKKVLHPLAEDPQKGGRAD